MAGLFVFASSLAACNAVTKGGLTHAKAVETDLERSTGLKPQGRLQLERRPGQLGRRHVPAPQRIEARARPGDEIRDAGTKEFKRKPDPVVLAFALGS